MQMRRKKKIQKKILSYRLRQILKKWNFTEKQEGEEEKSFLIQCQNRKEKENAPLLLSILHNQIKLCALRKDKNL